MLFRHVLGYAPSNFVPAIVSFAVIYIFTRLLSPASYGVYALVFNVAIISQGIISFWLRTGSTRFYDRAEADGKLPQFITTIFIGYAISAALFSAIYAALLLAIPVSSHLVPALWLGLPFIVLKGLVTVNLGLHRAAGRIARYNLLECGQTVMGLVFSVVLVMVIGLKEDGILWGLIAGSLLAVLIDTPFMVRGLRSTLNKDQLRTLLTFGLPLTASVVLNLVLSSSDRILVEYFLGSAPVGIYSVSYGIMNQPMALIFFAVSMPGLPLAIRALEKSGIAAATDQMRRNGGAMLALAIPACIGLIAVQEHLAAVLIGAEFRQEALQIMPWIAVCGLLAGLQAHYFDHAFTLGKRPTMLIRSIGIAAVVNIVLNIILLPRIGLMGAVYATFVSYVVAILASIGFGRSVFRVPFPVDAALRASLATVPMWFALSSLQFPQTLVGLLSMVVIGAACYLPTAMLLNLCDLRTKLWHRFTRRLAT